MAGVKAAGGRSSRHGDGVAGVGVPASGAQELPRGRWSGVGVVVAALLALAACTGHDGSDAPGRAAGGGVTAPGSGLTSSTMLEPQCAPPPARRPIDGAKVVNGIVGGADLPRWQAADIGASVQLSDRRIVWVFGDTLRDPAFTPRIVANSMIISSGLCVSQVVPGDDGAVMPDQQGSVLWPMSAVVLRVEREQDELVVLSSRIRRGSGAYAFTFLGTSAAIFDVGPLGVPRLRRVEEITPDDPDPTQVNWGAAATVAGDWLYVYGTRLPSTREAFGRALHVARVPLTNPGDRRRWRFWDGAEWSADLRRSAPVLDAAGGVSQTLSVSAVGGRFVAVSKRDGDLGDFVYTWTAPGPTGPWTARRAVKAPAGFSTGRLEYAPLAHPEVPLTDGDLLVSISRNTTDLSALVRDPDLGRPRFVQIPPP